MSEIFELMHQAGEVAETAKDAMPHSLPVDKTTEKLAREILAAAKEALPDHRILKSLNFEPGDVSWVSVRSAMQAVKEALSSENMARVRAKNTQRPKARRGPWS